MFAAMNLLFNVKNIYVYTRFWVTKVSRSDPPSHINYTITTYQCQSYLAVCGLVLQHMCQGVRVSGCMSCNYFYASTTDCLKPIMFKSNKKLQPCTSILTLKMFYIDETQIFTESWLLLYFIL